MHEAIKSSRLQHMLRAIGMLLDVAVMPTRLYDTHSMNTLSNVSVMPSERAHLPYQIHVTNLQDICINIHSALR